MITNKDLRKMFNKLDKITGQNTKNIPVEFNPRLRRVAGRYVFYTMSFNPARFEFNNILKNLPYDEVEQIVIHEYSHYLRNSTYHKGNHQHDEEFKRIVKSLGGSETEPTVSNAIMEDIKQSKNKDYVHAVCCEKCGLIHKQYKTKCASIDKIINNYYCSCGGELVYKNLKNKSE